MATNTNPKDLVDTLNRFETPDAIADYLRGFGIKGDVEDSESCVISNWIMQNVDCAGVSTSDEIHVYGYDWVDQGSADYEISTCVKMFIDLFDRGFYPDLVIEYDDDYWGGCNCSGCVQDYDDLRYEDNLY